MKKANKKVTKKKVASNKLPHLPAAPTIQMRLASEIAIDAKQLVQAINAWMVVISDQGKQPRLAHAPKKVQAPFALDKNGLVSFVAEKKKIVVWQPQGKGRFYMAKDVDHPLQPHIGQLKKRLDQDIIWMGGYDKNKSLIFLPLNTGGKILHVLIIENEKWTIKKLKELALFSRLSSRSLKVALESRRLEKRMRRSSAISEIAQNINTTLDIEILLRLIVLEVTKAMNCQAGNIWLINEQQGKMELRIGIGLSEAVKAILERTMLPIEDWDKRNSMTAEEVETIQDSRARVFQGTGFQTILTIPLRTKSKVIGIIQLFSKWPRDILKEDDDLMRTLANLAATVIDNARLFKESQRKAQELLAVYEVGQVVSETANIERALEHIVERVSEMLDVEKSWIMFYQPKTQLLSAHPVAIGAVDEQLEALQVAVDNETISSIVYRSSKPMFSNDAKELPVIQEEYDGIFNLRNVMAVPMRGRDETLGVFLAANKRGDALFTGSDVRLFKTLASTAANVVQHANLYEKLERSNLSMVKVISKMIDAHEPYTRGHSRRVAYYSQRLAQELNLPTPEVEQIRMAGLLHDIGKLGTGEKLIFSMDGRSRQKPHVLIGEQMLKDVDFPWEVNHLVKYHHEHMDGSGSPEGLREEAIPLGARIIAVADTFDVTVSLQDGETHSFDEGLAKIKECSGKQLDTKLVELFLLIWPQLEQEKI